MITDYKSFCEQANSDARSVESYIRSEALRLGVVAEEKERKMSYESVLQALRDFRRASSTRRLI